MQREQDLSVFKRGDLVFINAAKNVILMVTAQTNIGVVLWANENSNLFIGDEVQLNLCNNVSPWSGRLILET